MATVNVSKLQADTTIKTITVAELRIATSASPQVIVSELRANSGGASAQVIISELSVQTTSTATRYRAVGGVWVPTSRKHAIGGTWQ